MWVGTFIWCEWESAREWCTNQLSPWKISVVKHSVFLKQTSGEACKKNFRLSQKDDHTSVRELLWKMITVATLYHRQKNLPCLAADLFGRIVVSHFSSKWHYHRVFSFARLLSRLNVLRLKLPTPAASSVYSAELAVKERQGHGDVTQPAALNNISLI